jgi:hypothetical protein
MLLAVGYTRDESCRIGQVGGVAKSVFRHVSCSAASMRLLADLSPSSRHLRRPGAGPRRYARHAQRPRFSPGVAKPGLLPSAPTARRDVITCNGSVRRPRIRA